MSKADLKPTKLHRLVTEATVVEPMKSKKKPVVKKSETKRRVNPWIEHVRKWKLDNPELASKLKVTEITKEARKSYTPVAKKSVKKSVK